ncbi:hypothetical protein [Leucobacter sp. G161]|uniref:hypothetical protein n=1 Tax=Leucobacter sp. G161 TaxID=663704 RepID=UPI00073C5176|nr:hypothetical protein [Leucobacter sp. G161]KUF07186.1 hypothetical protein AUL38_02550 [Leucobacter sp. G161]
MTAFASADDVATAMKRTFTVEEKEWIDTLLEQSADAMRGMMNGQWVFPKRQSTFTAYPIAGRVNLPQGYVKSVDAVTRAGASISWSRFEDQVLVKSDSPCEVTFTYGLATCPPVLVGLNVVMVSSAITLVENDLGLSVGGLSSVALDDFRIAFADGGDKTGHLVLPHIQQQMLQQRFGQTGFVLEFR